MKELDQFFLKIVKDKVNIHNAVVNRMKPVCSYGEILLIEEMLWKGLYEVLVLATGLTKEELRAYILEASCNE